MLNKIHTVAALMAMFTLVRISAVHGSTLQRTQENVVIPLAEVMAYLGFDTAQEEMLRRGQILSKSITNREKTDRELAIASVMIVVRRPLEEVAAVFLRGDSFRVYENVRQLHEITHQGAATGTAAEFDGIRFAAQEKRDESRLSKSVPGNTFNLSENEIGLFKNAQKNKPDSADATTKILRQILYNRYKRYREAGLAGIEPYARTRGRSVLPGKELRSALDAMVIAKKHLPGFHRYLVEFPHADSNGMDSKFYWLKLHMASRPNFALVHQHADIAEDYAVVVEKIYYSLHTLDSSLVIIGCLPCEEGATVFYMNHLFTEKVSGFGSSWKKKAGKKVLSKSVSAYFGRLREKMEGSQSE